MKRVLKTERIRSPRNYKPTDLSYEKVTDHVSMTIPDMALSIPELMATAQMNPPTEDGYLGEDVELNRAADIARMELTDQMETLQTARRKHEELKAKQLAAYTAEQRRIHREQIKAELEAENGHHDEKPKDDKSQLPERPTPGKKSAGKPDNTSGTL